MIFRYCLKVGGKYFAVIAALSVLGALAHVGLVYAGRLVLEHYTSPATSTALVIAVGLLGVLSAGLAYFSAVMRGQLAARVETKLAGDVFQKLLALGNDDLRQLNTGKTKTILSSDIRYVANFCAETTRTLLPAAIALVVTTPFLYVWAGVPGLAGILAIFLVFPLVLRLRGLIGRLRTAVQSREDALANDLSEWLVHQKWIRLFGWSPRFETRLREDYRTLLTAATRSHGVNLVLYTVTALWWMVGIAAILLTHVWLDVRLEITSFFSVLWLLTILVRYLFGLPSLLSEYSGALACERRIIDFFAAPEADRAPAAATRATKVHFRGVSLVLGDETVLRDLNLTIDLSRRTAVTGSIGAGKTSLLKLLTGELRPTEGEIVYEGGEGIEAGYVPQSPFIAAATVRENVTLDFENPALDVEAALEAAALEGELAAEASVGEGGALLSGGQRQRVNVARALWSRRPFLILDDPFSHLDKVTERTVFRGILATGLPFFLISQNTETLRHADTLVILDKSVVACGPPDELLARQGRDA